MASESPPSIESESVSHLSSTNATLEAQVNTGGVATHYQLRLQYGCGISPGEACAQFCIVPGPCPGPVNGPVDIPLPSGDLPGSSQVEHVSLDLHEAGVTLEPATKYRYSIEATNTVGTVKGPGQIFTTPSMGATVTAPSIDSVSVSNVTEHDATLEAQINPNGLETTYEFHLASPACQSEWPMVGPCFAISAFPLPSATIPAGFGDQTVRLDINTAGKTLRPGTWYEYAVIASNADGEVIGHNPGEGPGIGRNFAGGGGEQNFQTLSPDTAPSEVVTGAAEQTYGGFKLNGEINPENSPTNYYFEYIGNREAECLGIDNCWPHTAQMGPITGDSQQQLQPIEVTDLRADETYTYRLVASNTKGTVQGNRLTFTTPDEEPPSDVVTEPAEATASGFRLRGELNPGNSPTAYYFIYKDTGEECEDLEGCGPETAHGGPLTGDTQQEVPALEVTGLEPGKTYRYWLIARNSKGVALGHELTFTVPASHARPLGEEEEPILGARNETPSTSGTGQSEAGGPSSLTPTLHVHLVSSLAATPTKSVLLSRSEKLKRALKQCSKEPRDKRAACETRAKKKYQPEAKKKRKKK